MDRRNGRFCDVMSSKAQGDFVCVLPWSRWLGRLGVGQVQGVGMMVAKPGLQRHSSGVEWNSMNLGCYGVQTRLPRGWGVHLQ